MPAAPSRLTSPRRASQLVEVTNKGYKVSDLTGALIQGNVYRLKEVSAPAGYELLHGSLTFEVNADGSITKDDALPQGFDVSFESGLVTITVTDELVEAQIRKVGMGGEPLVGATFAIKPVEGGAFGTIGLKHIGSPITADGSIELTTDEDGIIDLVGLLLPGDSYVITEVEVPAGYKPISPVTITVDEAGAVRLVGDGGAELDELVPADGIGSYKTDNASGTAVLTVKDDPIAVDLELVKVDTRGNALNGATFTIEGVFADGDGTAEARAYTVGTDGRLGILNLAAGQTYVVTEVTATVGYRLIDEPFELEVGVDGIVSAEDTSEAPQGGGRTAGYYLDDDGVTLVAVDEPRPWTPPVDEPDEPGDPDEPGEPENPDEPGIPDEPDEPNVPDDPGVPQTGDPSLTWLWSALCLASLSVLGLLAFTKPGRRGRSHK